MPIVLMPDGVSVEMPDNPTPEQITRLKAVRDKQPKTGQSDLAITTGGASSPETEINPGLPTSEGLKKASPYVRNTLEFGGMAGGATIPTIFGNPEFAPLGAGLGFATGKKAANVYDALVGLPTPTLIESLKMGPSEIDQGAMSEMTGQVGGALIARAKPFLTNNRSTNLLNDLAYKEARNSVAEFAPAGSSKKLFAEATAQNQNITMPNTEKMAQNILNDISQRSPEAQKQAGIAARWAQGLLKDMGEGKAFTPNKVNQELISLGQSLGSAENKPVKGELSQLFKAIQGDLANASDIPGFEALKNARSTFMREKAVESLSDTIDSAFKIRRGMGDQAQFNPNIVMQKLQNDEWFPKAFKPEEQQQIFNLMTTLNKIPVVAPPQGAKFGSGPVVDLIKKATIPTSLGYYFGGGTGAMIAGSGVIAADYGANVAKNMALAMSMQTGRDLLNQLTEQGSKGLTHEGIALLSAFVQQQRAKKEITDALMNARSKGNQ